MQGDHSIETIGYAGEQTDQYERVVSPAYMPVARLALILGGGYVLTGVILAIVLLYFFGAARNPTVALGIPAAGFGIFALPGFILAGLSVRIGLGSRVATILAMIICLAGIVLLALAILVKLFFTTTILAVNYFYNEGDHLKFRMETWFGLAAIWIAWWGTFGLLIPTRFSRKVETERINNAYDLISLTIPRGPLR